jgi:hypothetical protein
MGCWDKAGNGVCQTCGKLGPGYARRKLAIDFLRVLGWHYGAGETIGGQQYEQLLCPVCSKNEHRRAVTKPSIDQDELPIDWGQVQEQSQGGHTR